MTSHFLQSIHVTTISSTLIEHQRSSSFWCSLYSLRKFDIIVSSGHRLSNRPKLTVMLKSLLCSTICLDTANETVLKLKTEPAPFACEAHGKLYQVSSQTSRGKIIIRSNEIMLKWHHKFLIDASRVILLLKIIALYTNKGVFTLVSNTKETL